MNTDTVLACTTHIRNRVFGSCNRLVLAKRICSRQVETGGDFYIVTITLSVRLSNDGRKNAGYVPVGWYRLKYVH